MEKRRRRKQERDRKKRKRKELRAKEKAAKAAEATGAAEPPPEAPAGEAHAPPGLLFNKVRARRSATELRALGAWLCPRSAPGAAATLRSGGRDGACPGGWRAQSGT